MVCPNCKRPLLRKKAIKSGVPYRGNYCGYCGSDISSTIKEALEITGVANKSDQ
nr:MAG TPA: RimK-related lysine biosynthesis protein, Probable-dependent amine/thiol ligase family Amino-group [Caudoviricetes sp.]